MTTRRRLPRSHPTRKPKPRPSSPSNDPPEPDAATIRGVFTDLGLDDPDVRSRLKRLEKGWSTEEPTPQPQLMIRGDTAETAPTQPRKES